MNVQFALLEHGVGVSDSCETAFIYTIDTWKYLEMSFVGPNKLVTGLRAANLELYPLFESDFASKLCVGEDRGFRNKRKMQIRCHNSINCNNMLV